MPLLPGDSEAVGASVMRSFTEVATWTAGRGSGESGPDRRCSSSHPPGLASLASSRNGGGLIIGQPDLRISYGTESGTP